MIFLDTNQKLKKKIYFILLQNRFDILKPKDFVLFNKNKSNFFLPKLIFFLTYTKSEDKIGLYPFQAK